MPEFVSVTQGDQIVSVTKSRATKLGLDVVDSPAADRSGRPLPPRPAPKAQTVKVDDVLAAVGDDPVKAAAALADEQARRDRKSVV